MSLLCGGKWASNGWPKKKRELAAVFGGGDDESWWASFFKVAICCFCYPPSCPISKGWIFYDFDFPRLLCVASPRIHNHGKLDCERGKKYLNFLIYFCPSIINICTQTETRKRRGWGKKSLRWYADPQKLSCRFFFCRFLGFPTVWLLSFAFKFCLIIY